MAGLNNPGDLKSGRPLDTTRDPVLTAALQTFE